VGDSPDAMRTFHARLGVLRVQVGEPSYGDLEKAASLSGRALAKQTISDLLSGNTRSRWGTVETFVLACRQYAKRRRIGVSEGTFDLTRWRAEFDDARRPRTGCDGGPLREPYRATDTAETPMRLLRAEYAVVPFQNRDELTVLQDWCRQVADGDRTGLAVVHGVGGAGKTRLVLELAHRLRATGWHAGVLPQQTDAAVLTTVTEPVLVVVDYADGRVSDVIALLKTLRRRKGSPAVVVLTARSIEGEWLPEIIGSLDDDRHAYRREEICLPDRHPDSGNIYLRTVAALHADDETLPKLPTPARGVRWTTLDLVLLGWIAASGASILPVTQAELYDEVLRHEENYWCTVYTSLAADAKPERSLLRKAAAVVSLVTPTDLETGTVLTAIKDLDDDPRERRIVRRTLVACLSPAAGEGLAVRPDPIGDRLLLCEFDRDPVLVHATLARAGEERLEAALVALDRAGQQDSETSIGIITALVKADSERWRTILTVAARQAGPALIALQRLAAHLDTSLPLNELSESLPFSTLSLFDLALIVDQKRLTRARAAAAPPAVLAELLARVSQRADHAGDRVTALAAMTEAATQYRDLAATDAVHLPNLAAALTNLGTRFSELGRRESALAASQEAVDLYHQLGANHPSDYRPALARSLSNLGMMLAGLGHPEQAVAPNQEAVDLYRELAASDPASYMPELAMALTNLGVMLSSSGHRELAVAPCEDAVDLCRELVARNPATYLPNLASSLANLSMALSELGRHEPALGYSQEAAALHRQLTAGNPAYLPKLAASLTNLGRMLSKLGRHESALASSQEAVDLYRVSVASHSAHLPNLAASLTNLSMMRLDLGQHELALAACQEAVDLYRNLAASYPAAHLPDLALTLINLGRAQSRVGHQEHALASSQEAVDLYRDLSAANPTAHLPHLAASLSNLGTMQAQLGHHEKALVSTQEAVTLRRTLAASDPTAYVPQLAISLSNLGAMLSHSGHEKLALVHCQEAVELCRELAAHNPAVYLPDLAMALTNLGAQLFELGHHGPAVMACQDAVGACRKLAASNPATHLPDLARSLNNLGAMLSKVGHHEQALAACQHAVDTYRQLAASNPAHVPDLASSLNNLAIRLSKLDRHEPALAACQEAVTLDRDLAAQNPATHLPNFAASLINLGAILSKLGHHQNALASGQEAVTILRTLATDKPAIYLPDLAMSLHNLGGMLSEQGRHESALAACHEAVTLRQKLAADNPATHVSGLTASLNNLSDRLAETGQDDAAVEIWQNAIGAMPSDIVRAELRAGLAWRLAHTGLLDQAGDELRRAAAEAESPSREDDNTDPTMSTFLTSRARLAVRTAASALQPGTPGLPVWAATPVPDSHVNLVNAVAQATSWPTMRAALDDHRGLLSAPELIVSLNVLRALHPGDPTLDNLTRLLDDVGEAGIDIFFDVQQTLHDNQALLNAWIGTTTWAESATFYRKHRDALATDNCRRILTNLDNAVANQHLALLELGDTLPIDEAYTIVTDPSAAESAAFDAIELGDLHHLAIIMAAAPNLQDRPMTWALLSAVHLLTHDKADQAKNVARQIAEHDTPILRRAHAVRLRTLNKHRPELTAVLDLAEIIDLGHAPD
jgi:tetratricopeptide (TPR) repeat protein